MPRSVARCVTIVLSRGESFVIKISLPGTVMTEESMSGVLKNDINKIFEMTEIFFKEFQGDFSENGHFQGDFKEKIFSKEIQGVSRRFQGCGNPVETTQPYT